MSEHVKPRVLDRVIELTYAVPGAHAEGTIDADTVLVGKAAAIDSIALLEVLEAVTDEFGVIVLPADIALTNLSSVGSLAEMVARRID